jgi:hypothetical protein
MRVTEGGRAVESALLATIACHAVAMVAMAGVLLSQRDAWG